MKYLDLYTWIAGSKSNFLKPFKNNDDLYNTAKNFWESLDSFTIVSIIIFIVLGIGMAISYYTKFNNEPGRHYKPRWWLIFLAITLVLTFISTWLAEYMAVTPPSISNAVMLEVKIAFGNAIYASILYLLVSFIWCNWLPTNAYRLLKIR